jgi:hypothetical protein
MEIRGQLQCKALRRREKSRRRKNNGYQWKNNAKNNGNNEKYRGVTTRGRDACQRRRGVRAVVKENFAKYRRFTGRKCAPTAGKVIEIAQEKARALNRRITGAETGKNRTGNRKNRAINRTPPFVPGKRIRNDAATFVASTL